MVGAKNPGIPVHGEVTSADASAGIDFTLYDNEGNVITLATGNQVIIEQFFVFSAAGGRVAITTGTDVAGRRLRACTLPANSGILDSGIELLSRKGVVPKLFAAIGQVDAQFEGRIAKLT